MYGAEWQREKSERHILAANIAPFGISFLDDALLGLLPNDLLLVGAKTGKGKSELAATIAFNIANAGKQVAFFALEADQWEMQRRMKYRKLAQFYHLHYANQAKTFQFPRYREWLTSGFSPEWDALEKQAEGELIPSTLGLRILYKGSGYTPEVFCRELEQLEETVVVVDHLHYFDLVGNESESLKRAIHAIRNAALFHGKAVVLLAHLRKTDRLGAMALPTLDDFHGHSDIAKVCTTALLMAPAPQHHSLGMYPTYFHIAKCRTASEVTGVVGIMGFDFKTNSYSDRYFVERATGGEPEPFSDPGQIPAWCKRAIRPPAQSLATRYHGRKDTQ